MLHQPTVDKMLAMRLEAMVESWKRLDDDEQSRALPFDDKLALMVDHLFAWRENMAFAQRLKRAKLKSGPCVEDIDHRAPRGLDRSLLRALTADSGWVRKHENIFLLGPTDPETFCTSLLHR